MREPLVSMGEGAGESAGEPGDGTSEPKGLEVRETSRKELARRFCSVLGWDFSLAPSAGSWMGVRAESGLSERAPPKKLFLLELAEDDFCMAAQRVGEAGAGRGQRERRLWYEVSRSERTWDVRVGAGGRGRYDVVG